MQPRPASVQSVSATSTIAAPAPVAAPTLQKQETAVQNAAEEVYNKTINAPIGGKFYTSPGPGKPQFSKEGDVISAGGKVCIVEAMKLFNEISAPMKCKIIKFLAKDGQNVEKDQPLVAIEEV